MAVNRYSKWLILIFVITINCFTICAAQQRKKVGTWGVEWYECLDQKNRPDSAVVVLINLYWDPKYTSEGLTGSTGISIQQGEVKKFWISGRAGVAEFRVAPGELWIHGLPTTDIGWLGLELHPGDSIRVRMLAPGPPTVDASPEDTPGSSISRSDSLGKRLTGRIPRH